MHHKKFDYGYKWNLKNRELARGPEARQLFVWFRCSSGGRRLIPSDRLVNLIVAATALERRSQVATFNRQHFDSIAGLTIVEPA